MNTVSKVLIVIALLALVGVVMAVKYHDSPSQTVSEPAVNVPDAPKVSTGTSSPDATINVNTQAAEAQIDAVANAAEAVTDERTVEPQAVLERASGLPRLVDVGADKCIPCKMMAPILEELKTEYAGRLTVEFYDVWKDPSVGQRFSIQIIPTQVFYDPDGKELFRHVGFYSKPDILKKWNELGFDFQKGGE